MADSQTEESETPILGQHEIYIWTCVAAARDTKETLQ